MSQIVARSDQRTDQALASLMEITSKSQSEAVRYAITVAEREARIARAEKQAALLRADSRDRAEMLAILGEMEIYDAW